MSLVIERHEPIEDWQTWVTGASLPDGGTLDLSPIKSIIKGEGTVGVEVRMKLTKTGGTGTAIVTITMHTSPDANTAWNATETSPIVSAGKNAIVSFTLSSSIEPMIQTANFPISIVGSGFFLRFAHDGGGTALNFGVDVDYRRMR